MNKFITLLFVAALTAACESDRSVEPAGKTRRIDIVAHCDHSRTSLAEDGLGTVWATAETVGVFGSSTVNAAFTSNNTEPAPTATFSGSVTEGDTPQYAYYPFNAASTAASSVAFTLPTAQTQTGSVPDIAAADFKIGSVTANADGTYSAVFRQMMSLLRFTVDAAGTELAGRRLLCVAVSATGAPLAGEFTVDIAAETFSAAAPQDKVAVKLSDKPVLTAPVDVWAIVNPSLVTDDEIDVSITTLADNGDLAVSTFQLTLARDMARGDAYTVPVGLSSISGIVTETTPAVTLPEGAENVAAEGAVLTISISDLFDRCTVDSDSDWCTVTDNGDGTYTLIVAPNTGDSRTASISVAASSTESGVTVSESLAVTQAAGTTVEPAGETANCYIVTAAGSYSFNATVMGNGDAGIIDGAGFHTASAAISPVTAELLWQDTAGFITSVSLENGFVNYTASTALGNAMIAVRDAEGTILWSWHIWGTGGEMPADEVYTNKAGASFTVMDRSLGQLGMLRLSDLRADDGSIYIYDAAAKAPVLVKGEQNAYLCTLYQWGRKDPIPNGNTLYDIDGSVLADISASYPVYTDETTIAASVAHPSQMLNAAAGLGDWTTENNGLLWGDNNTKYFYNFSNSAAIAGWTDVKTIYDPCPAGYRVANKFTWTGFDATTDASATLKGNMNAGDVEKVVKCITTSFASGSATRYAPVYANGYFFMKTGADTEGAYYPQAGLRDASDGSPSSVGVSGSYWSSANNVNDHQAQYMTISQYEWLSDATGSSSKAAGNNGKFKMYGCRYKNAALAVRCVKIE